LLHVTGAVQAPAVVGTLILLEHERTGFSLSVTVTVKLHVTGPCPEGSVAEYEIVVTPLENEDPGAGPEVLVAAKEPQLSAAVGSTQLTILEQIPGAVVTTILLGQVSEGD